MPPTPLTPIPALQKSPTEYLKLIDRHRPIIVKTHTPASLRSDCPPWHGMSGLVWRGLGGHFAVERVATLRGIRNSGIKTVHELRQEQLPTSMVAKAFTHIQAPRLFLSAKPPGTPGRHALSVSSDYPAAVELVTRLYDKFGFDTVNNSPLSESWRSGPGQPAWLAHEHQTKSDLTANLTKARQIRSI